MTVLYTINKMEHTKLQTLFDAKMVETEPNRFLLANIQKKKFFEWFVHGFNAASNPTPMTIEEKVANAVFYVENNITYTIEYSMSEEGYFVVSSVDDQSGDMFVFFSDIPADAYFLGTVRL